MVAELAWSRPLVQLPRTPLERDDETLGEIAGLHNAFLSGTTSVVLSPDVVALRPFLSSGWRCAATPIATNWSQSDQALVWRRLESAFVAVSTPTHWESALAVSPSLVSTALGFSYHALLFRWLNKLEPWGRFLSRETMVEPETPITDPAVGAGVTGWQDPDVGQAIAQIRDWLGVSGEDVASAVGVSLRTLRYWQANSVAPRVGHARRLWRLHALALALWRTLGGVGARQWVGVGAPTPLSMLRSGDLSWVEDAARQVLFGDAKSRRRFSGFTLPDEQGVTPHRNDSQRTYQRASRRPKRAR